MLYHIRHQRQAPQNVRIATMRGLHRTRKSTSGLNALRPTASPWQEGVRENCPDQSDQCRVYQYGILDYPDPQLLIERHKQVGVIDSQHNGHTANANSCHNKKKIVRQNTIQWQDIAPHKMPRQRSVLGTRPKNRTKHVKGLQGLSRNNVCIRIQPTHSETVNKTMKQTDSVPGMRERNLEVSGHSVGEHPNQRLGKSVKFSGSKCRKQRLRKYKKQVNKSRSITPGNGTSSRHGLKFHVCEHYGTISQAKSPKKKTQHKQGSPLVFRSTRIERCNNETLKITYSKQNMALKCPSFRKKR